MGGGVWSSCLNGVRGRGKLVKGYCLPIIFLKAEDLVQDCFSC